MRYPTRAALVVHLALAVGLCSAPSSPAWAASPTSTAQAEDETTPGDGTDSVGEDADSDQQGFDALVQRASEAFAAKDYAAALGFFEQAYAIDQDPAILFNMGIIADKNGDFDKAIRYFNDFVMVPDIDVDAREEALRRLEQLRKLEALRAEQANKANDTKQTDPKEVTPTPPPEPPKEHSYTGPIIVTAAGGLLLAGGGVVAGLAQAQHSDFEAATTLAARRDAADSGKTLATTADILFVAGGLTAAAGVVWFLVEASGDEPQTLSLAPTMAPHTVGIDVALRF